MLPPHILWDRNHTSGNVCWCEYVEEEYGTVYAKIAHALRTAELGVCVWHSFLPFRGENVLCQRRTERERSRLVRLQRVERRELEPQVWPSVQSARLIGGF